MSYQVIARKWRPQTFEEVTGQEPITRTLRNAIEHRRLHHAYLFSGARGVGKTTTARLFAKALNCHRANAPITNPCAINDESACPSCREIADGRSIDVLEIDAASNTGVDNVRESIINSVGVRPARDRYKVFIIDEVHMLSGAAFNALLKTLEEPPAAVVFIMATTEAHKVPDTILSRCQQFEFRTIATPRIAERLRLIAAKEKIAVADDALGEIARAGEGSMRDAQSAFDQVISFSNEEEITVSMVETALGIAGREMLSRIVRSIAEHQPQAVLAVTDELMMRGHDLRNFCRDLLAHVRDLLVVKVAGEDVEMVDASDAERRELASLSNHFSEADLVRFFHSLTETEKHLRESAHPRYQLEIGIVKLIEMRRLAPLTGIIERLTTLEESLRRTEQNPSGGANVPSVPNGALPVTTSAESGSSALERSGTRSGIKSSAAAAAATASVNVSDVSNRASRAVTNSLSSHADQQQTPGQQGEVGSKHAAAASNPSLAAKIPALFESAAAAAAVTAAPLISSSLPSSLTSSLTSPPAALKLVPSSAPEEVATTTAASVSRSSDEAIGKDEQVGKPLSTDCIEATCEIFEPLKAALENRHRPFIAIALEGARSVRIEKDEVCIEYAPESKHLRDNVGKPDTMKLLREICREITGRDLGLRITVANTSSSGNSSKSSSSSDGRSSASQPVSHTSQPVSQQDEALREQAELREMAEKHPAVQQMLRTFRGEIIDVRRADADGN